MLGEPLFLLGGRGRSRVVDTLRSMPAEWGGAFLMGLIVFLIWCCYNKHMCKPHSNLFPHENELEGGHALVRLPVNSIEKPPVAASSPIPCAWVSALPSLFHPLLSPHRTTLQKGRSAPSLRRLSNYLMIFRVWGVERGT